MEPVTIVLLITTLVTAGLTFILNIFQSIKSQHFESDCGLCSCFYSSEHQTTDDETK